MKPQQIKWILFLGGILVTCLLFGMWSWLRFPNPNKSFLEGMPCSPPCWQNITPGVTQEKAALTAIYDLPTVSRNSIQSFGKQWIFAPFGAGQNRLYISDDIVYRVDLTVNFDFTVGDAIEEFGEPDFVYADFDGEHPVCYFSDIFFLERGVWIQARECRENQVTGIFPDNEVYRITFLEPQESLEIFLQKAIQPRDDWAIEIAKDSEVWSDYGRYMRPPNANKWPP